MFVINTLRSLCSKFFSWISYPKFLMKETLFKTFSLCPNDIKETSSCVFTRSLKLCRIVIGLPVKLLLMCHGMSYLKINYCRFLSRAHLRFFLFLCISLDPASLIPLSFPVRGTWPSPHWNGHGNYWCQIKWNTQSSAKFRLKYWN